MSQIPSEADLEAKIAQVIQAVFPAVSANDIKHQKSFRLQLGHGQVEVDGTEKSWIGGRLDILINIDGKPVALLELKRANLDLTDDDRKQGLSYARLTDPWPPFTIVSNGNDTVIYETFSGNEWAAKTIEEKSVEGLVKRSAELAAEDLRNAVDVLLSTRPDVWRRLIEGFSNDQIDRLTGKPSQLQFPFPSELMFPRIATYQIADMLRKSENCLLVTGPPLIGKSNILRELFYHSQNSNDLAVLYADCDCLEHGIFQFLANLLTTELDLQFSVDQVRAWIRTISNSERAPKLVLALDVSDITTLKTDIHELNQGHLGKNVGVVIACDNKDAEKLVKNKKGRATSLASKLKEVPIEPLNGKEFNVVLEQLAEMKIGFLKGAQRTLEYRMPWMLAGLVASAHPVDPDAFAVFPSIYDARLIPYAESIVKDDDKLKDLILKTCEALILDLDNKDISTELLLYRTTTSFACSEAAVRAKFTENEADELIRLGYLRLQFLNATKTAYVPQVPHLMMWGIGRVLADMLEQELENDRTIAIENFIARCEKLFAGDSIGAYAILILGQQNNLATDIINSLYNLEPEVHSAAVGTKSVTIVGGVKITFEVVSETELEVTYPGGKKGRHPMDAQEKMIGRQTPWLILSHILATPFGVMGDSIEKSIVVNPELISLIAQSKYPLRRPSSNPESILYHDIGEDVRVVCDREGITEPITLAMYACLLREQEKDELLERVKGSNSIPAISRLLTALSNIPWDNDESKWYETKHGELVDEFREQLDSFYHD